MKANCIECHEKGWEIPGEFVLLDEVVNQLKPLCNQHLQEYLVMFGEDMTDYCHISNDAEILRLGNAKLKFLTERYTAILRQIPKEEASHE